MIFYYLKHQKNEPSILPVTSAISLRQVLYLKMEQIFHFVYITQLSKWHDNSYSFLIWQNILSPESGYTDYNQDTPTSGHLREEMNKLKWIKSSRWRVNINILFSLYYYDHLMPIVLQPVFFLLDKVEFILQRANIKKGKSKRVLYISSHSNLINTILV